MTREIIKYFSRKKIKLLLTLNMLLKISVILFVFFTSAYYLFPQSDTSGSLTGIILDAETQQPVRDAILTLVNIDKNTASDSNGKFTFKDIPLGTYQMKISCTGYETTIKTDLVVLSSRPSLVTVELIPKSYITEIIEVEAKYYQKPTDQNSSMFNLDFEEVRRAPGAVEDISRMVQILPGVSPGNDQRNDLIVRGGSPAENLIIIDGIEVPNINHYPSQASTGGPIGLINVKFISDVNFSTGGFSSRFGDKLSSVLDIKFREGYRKKFLSDINLSTAGFGGVFEGPLFSQNGSFLVSIRKSYLNLIRGAIQLAAVPDYWDFNLKAVYDLNQNHKLTFIGLGGLDKISFEGNEAEISDENPYGKAKGNQEEFTLGLNLKSLYKNGFIQSVFSNSSNFYKYDNRDFKTDSLIFDNNSYESEFNLKSEIFYQINQKNNIIAGGSFKYTFFKNDLFVASDTSYFGDVLPELNIKIKDQFYKASAFCQYTLKLFQDKTIINLGMRYDYFSGIEEKNSFSPRLGLSYKLSETTILNFAAGIFHQAPEYLWVTTDPKNYKLKYLRAYHYVGGVEHILFDVFRFTAEVYYKKYERYPVSVLIPTYVLIAGGADNGPNFVGEAVSLGYGYVKGLDISLQKKLDKSGFYGMLNYSLTESKVTALVRR